MPTSQHLFVSSDPLVLAAALHHPADMEVLLAAIRFREAWIEMLVKEISCLQTGLRRLTTLDGCPFRVIGAPCPLCGEGHQLPLEKDNV